MSIRADPLQAFTPQGTLNGVYTVLGFLYLYASKGVTLVCASKPPPNNYLHLSSATLALYTMFSHMLHPISPPHSWSTFFFLLLPPSTALSYILLVNLSLWRIRLHITLLSNLHLSHQQVTPQQFLIRTPQFSLCFIEWGVSTPR